MMKRILFLFVLMLGFQPFMVAQHKDVVSVVALGENLPAGVSLAPIVDQFVTALKQATDNQYDVVDRNKDFMRFISNELDYQKTGKVDDRMLTEIGKQLGANLICAVLVQWSAVDADYYFRVRMLDMERTDIIFSASYPEEILWEKKVKTLERKELQKVSLHLIKKMNFLPRPQQSRLEQIIDDFETKPGQDLGKRKTDSNLKALGASAVMPGLGLMRKGYGSKGCAYLIGDVALVGGGLGLLAYANHEKGIMEDRGTDYDSYNRAKNAYDNAGFASKACFVSACAVYLVNLWRSYSIDAKPCSPLDYRLEASYFGTPGDLQPGVGFTIAYRF